MSNTQAPMTIQDNIRALVRDITDLLDLGLTYPHAQECCIGLGYEIERQAGILHEQTLIGIGNHAMRLICEEMIPTETPEEAEALDLVPEKFFLSTWELDVLKAYPKVMKKIDREVLRQAQELQAEPEAKRIDNSHVHAAFAPALDLVGPPREMNA